jgi:glycosyltransferase involved in cell wall biosynthesis
MTIGGVKKLIPRPVKRTLKVFMLRPDVEAVHYEFVDVDPVPIASDETLAPAQPADPERLRRLQEQTRKQKERLLSQQDKTKGLRSQLDRARQLNEKAQNQRSRSKQKIDDLTVQRDKARKQVRQLRDQRDTAREDLRGARSRLSEIQREVRFPEEAWWEQRTALAAPRGLGLHDLTYFPGGTQNPYLRLLYARCPEVGFDARPLGSLDHLYRLPADSAFHLHWTRIAQLGATTEEQARERTAEFLAPIESFVERGGTFLWSIHEPLPHDCPFPNVEIELRERLIELAHGVHVLHARTVEEVEPYYTIDPDKLFVVDHPLYDGIYESYLSRQAARSLVGLEDDEVLLLAFGAIRPYKGFARLVRLLPRLIEETGLRLRVMVAGPTMASIDNSELLDAVEVTAGTSITDRPIPDEYVQVMFKSADVVVLPYHQVLNSGVLMLGLTFGCRSVAPDNSVTRDTLNSELVHLFDRTSDEDLFRAVKEALAARGDQGALPATFRDRYDASAVAGQFAAHLERLIVHD